MAFFFFIELSNNDIHAYGVVCMEYGVLRDYMCVPVDQSYFDAHTSINKVQYPSTSIRIRQIQHQFQT